MGDDYRTNGGSIIVQMGDDWGFAPSPICTIIIPHSPVDGRSIIVQMGDGAKPLPPSMAIAYYQGDPSPW